MRDATPRAFAPIPELATDAEISGLFRLLEHDHLNSQPPPNGEMQLVAAPGQRETSTPPQSECEGSQLGRSPAARNARSGTFFTSCDRPFDARTARAFAGLARAVAAGLNR